MQPDVLCVYNRSLIKGKLFTDLNKLYTFRARRRWWEWPQWYIIQLLQTERGAAARKKFIFPTWHRGKKQFDLFNEAHPQDLFLFFCIYRPTCWLEGDGYKKKTSSDGRREYKRVYVVCFSVQNESSRILTHFLLVYCDPFSAVKLFQQQQRPIDFFFYPPGFYDYSGVCGG